MFIIIDKNYSNSNISTYQSFISFYPLSLLLLTLRNIFDFSLFRSEEKCAGVEMEGPHEGWWYYFWEGVFVKEVRYCIICGYFTMEENGICKLTTYNPQ